MRRMVLEAMPEDWYGESMIKKALGEENVTYFRLREHEIKNCRCCEGCGNGKCVHRDIMDDILSAYANSDEIYFVTPIHFGSYNTLFAKVLGRLIPTASALYKVKGGYMIHPSRYPDKKLVGIGQEVMGQEGEGRSFKKLVEHNARNFECVQVKTMTFKTQEQLAALLEQHSQDRGEDWKWVFKKS